jgi:S-adenosylmethionine-diacylglycerol 3-amino-3-carboxypropyl transferase
LGRTFRHLFHLDFSPYFECDSLEDQRATFQRDWPRARLKSFLAVAAHPWIFNRVLYKGSFAGTRQTLGSGLFSTPFADFLMDTFATQFNSKLVRESFFLQMLFLGELVYPEGFPLEADPEVYWAARQFQGEIQFRNQDFISAMGERSYDFYSLSDTLSYLPGEKVQDLWRLIRAGIQDDPTRVFVLRSFLRHPTLSLDLLPWYDEGAANEAGRQDTTGVYKFHIFRRIVHGEYDAEA